MRFELLQREIDIRWTHIGVYLVLMLALILLFAALSGIIAGSLSVATGSDFSTVYFLTVVNLAGIYTIANSPISAFLLLLFASVIFKLKKDVSLCRSLVAAYFLVNFVIFLVIYIAASTYIETAQISQFFDPFALVASILSSLAVTIILYLWLLIFLKPEKKRIRKTALYAVLFAIVFFLLREAYIFFSYYNMGGIYAPPLDSGVVLWLVHKFLLGFALLYFSKDIKKLGKEAYLYAALVLGEGLFSTLGNFFGTGWASSEFLLGLMGLVMAPVSLVLIYIISLKMEEREA
jgi:hypothetical protein